MHPRWRIRENGRWKKARNDRGGVAALRRIGLTSGSRTSPGSDFSYQYYNQQLIYGNVSEAAPNRNEKKQLWWYREFLGIGLRPDRGLRPGRPGRVLRLATDDCAEAAGPADGPLRR